MSEQNAQAMLSRPLNHVIVTGFLLPWGGPKTALVSFPARIRS